MIAALRDSTAPLHELEGVLSMPDGTPHERIPCDDIWPQYVEGLAAQVAPAISPSDSPCNSATRLPHMSGSAETASRMAPAGGLPTAPVVPTALAMGAPACWAMPLAHGTMLARGGPTLAMPFMPMPTGTCCTISKQQQAAAVSKMGGKNAVSQRQVTNREAQKRYRDRQKARLLEMQCTLDSLTRKLADLENVRRQNAALEEQHFQLQAQLARVETEADALQWQRQQQRREAHQLCGASCAGQTAPQDAPPEGQPRPALQAVEQLEASSVLAIGERHDSVGSLPADGDDALATPDTQDATAGAGSKVEAGMYGRPPPAEAFDDLICRFQAQIAKVKTFLDEQGLRNHHPCSVLLSTSVRGQLLTLIKESLGICRDLLRVEGVDVIELLQHQDEAAMAAPAAPGSSVRRKWLHVIRALQLIPTQQQQLLLLRSAHLTLMRRIYGQRQQLNMQAMSLMLAGSSGMQPAGGGQAAKLAAVLGSIKESLRREQRAAMEINATTLARILSPVQAALYISEAFPLHCDALGLCNVLATMGAADTSDSGGGSAGTPRHSTSVPSGA